MTVAEMLARISSSELSEWIEFYKIEPFGSDVDLLGHAITSSTVANVNLEKGKKPFKPTDFMPDFEADESKPQSVDQQIEFAAIFTAALGGEDKRHEKETG